MTLITKCSNSDPYVLTGQVNAWCQEIQLPNGHFYQGEMRNNVPHGRGTMKYTQPNEKQYDQYEGEFVDGVPHGLGKMVWADGSIYEGAFENDNLQGYGIKTWSGRQKNMDGTLTAIGEKIVKIIQKGEWKNGLMDGQGLMTITVAEQYIEEGYCFHPTVSIHNEEYIRRLGVFKNGYLWEGESKMVDSIFRYVNGKRQQASYCVIY